MRLARGWRTRVIGAAAIAVLGLAIPIGAHWAGAAGVASHSRTTSAVVKVTINNFAFTPMTVTVTAGTTVVWTNRQAGTPHTVTADNGSFTSKILNPGAHFSHKFTTAGTITYHCKIHPFMHGAVVVK